MEILWGVSQLSTVKDWAVLDCYTTCELSGAIQGDLEPKSPAMVENGKGERQLRRGSVLKTSQGDALLARLGYFIVKAFEL